MPMGTFDENVGKTVSRRAGTGDPIEDAAILLETIAALRGPGLCPRGVYRFHTFEEADQWALKMSARSPARPD